MLADQWPGSAKRRSVQQRGVTAVAASMAIRTGAAIAQDVGGIPGLRAAVPFGGNWSADKTDLRYCKRFSSTFHA